MAQAPNEEALRSADVRQPVSVGWSQASSMPVISSSTLRRPGRRGSCSSARWVMTSSNRTSPAPRPDEVAARHDFIGDGHRRSSLSVSETVENTRRGQLSCKPRVRCPFGFSRVRPLRHPFCRSFPWPSCRCEPGGDVRSRARCQPADEPITGVDAAMRTTRLVSSLRLSDEQSTRLRPSTTDRRRTEGAAVIA